MYYILQDHHQAKIPQAGSGYDSGMKGSARNGSQSWEGLTGVAAEVIRYLEWDASSVRMIEER
jgi:hypothetical protein